jgi:putative phosphoribosyl transferase
LPGRAEPYADREQAGRVLADCVLGRLVPAGRDDVLVLGLPRGGVPVAAPVAAALGAPLDVLVVRKLGLPWQPELAMGAIAGVGDAVELLRNEAVLAAFGVSESAFDLVKQRELSALLALEVQFRSRRSAVPLRGRVLIVVDDGLATGSTMLAAVAAARRQEPARIVVAVPVAAARTRDRVRAAVDDVICAWTPADFVAVGAAYRDFSATSDDEVRRILGSGRPNPGS